MSLINKMTLSGLVLCLSLAAGTQAFANEEGKADSSDANGILFRIENIEPQKNQDGLIDKCKFLITAYNRMNVGVKSATMEFKWTDTISQKFKIDGGAIKTVSNNQATTVISKEVNLDGIGAHKQRSFEEMVETDKCFLLFDTVDYTIKNCYVEGENVSRDNSGKGSCANKFDYITTANPEYYSEFKDVPDSVIEKQAEDEKKQEVQKIDETVAKSLSELKEVSEVLEKIK